MSESVPNIMKTVTPSPNASSSPSINKSTTRRIPFALDGGGNIIKILLIVFIILFLGYNLYLYYYEGTDILGKYFGINIGGRSVNNVEDVKQVVNTQEAAADTKTENAEEDKLERKSESPVQQAINKPSVTREDNVESDVSTESEIQKAKKGNYCYIGTDRTFRSCVKMNDFDTCVSGKIFPTKDICINPNLRE